MVGARGCRILDQLHFVLGESTAMSFVCRCGLQWEFSSLAAAACEAVSRWGQELCCSKRPHITSCPVPHRQRSGSNSLQEAKSCFNFTASYSTRGKAYESKDSVIAKENGITKKNHSIYLSMYEIKNITRSDLYSDETKKTITHPCPPKPCITSISET